MTTESKGSKQFDVNKWLDRVGEKVKKEEEAFPFTPEILRVTTNANLSAIRESLQKEKFNLLEEL